MTKLIDITGKALSGEWGSDDETGDGIPVLRTTNFTNEGVVNYNDVVTRIITKKNIDNKFLRKGDIIIEKSGGSDKFPVGRVIYFNGDENTYLFNNFTGLLRVKNQEQWFPKYVFYSLFANYKRGGTRIYENKTTGLHNLKTDDYVSRYEVVDMNKKQQVLICEKLDKLCEIIKLRKKELQLLDDLIKARFIELFGDLKTNSKGWQIVGFKDCADIDTNMVHDFEGYEDYPHIGIDSIEKKTGRLIGYRTIAEDGITSGKYLFTPEHIIYSKIRPNLNKVAMPDFDGLCSADAYPILVKEGICNREYFGYTLRSQYFLDYILAFSNRTNLPKVNKSQVEGFVLPLPPIEVQEQFAAFVAQTDKSKVVHYI
nr:restriction endonuclease subunit S [Eubacterium ramulus]